MSLKSLVEKVPGYNSLVRPVHYVQAVRAAKAYGYPARGLRVIGVTGTNGKTTTSFMIWKMLNVAGHKTGLLTTVGWGGVDGGSVACERASQAGALDATVLHPQIEHMTTESVGVLNKRMRAIADAGAEFLVLEVTSHALMQSRILGVPIEIAVFTNLTHEHLDYHKTFENYRKAKLRLFKKAKAGVINADDPNAKYFEEEMQRYACQGAEIAERGEKTYSSCDIITYGIEHGDMKATEVELLDGGVKYACGDIKIKTQIPGKFNVYNSLAAVCVGRKLGLTNRQIERGIGALESVNGRMNKIDEGQDFTVIVDYAHTPDALLKVLTSVGGDEKRKVATAGSSEKRKVATAGSSEKRKGSNEERKTRIITVHGGAGRRDESTRAERGKILGEYSDFVIITEDDSRDEDPEKIAEQFVLGAEKAGKRLGENLVVELDRREAIRKALKEARKGDLVLVLGKGHEKTILRVDGAHEFEDATVVKELLAERK